MASRLRPWLRAAVGGAAGAVAAFALAFLLFFRLAGPLLFDPVLQSPKLLAVWQELEPLPLVLADPGLFTVGVALLGAVHGLVFRGIVRGLPADPLRRGLAFGLVLWALMALFFEFFAPLNLFGEPLALVALELALWLPVLLVEGLVLSLVYGKA